MDWTGRRIHTILEASLLEDRATSDATTALTIDPGLRAAATVLAKEDCVVSGLGCIPQFLHSFAQLEGWTNPHTAPRFEVVHHPEIFDGVRVKSGQALAVIRHNARVILACERVILNLMQRMCGVATLTQQYVKAVAGTGSRILDTRKTVPGLRVLDKYAVTCGGGMNHRLDLSDGILIKNNHITLGGGLKPVLERALARRKPGQVVQVEVRNFEELALALDGGAESVLLDNMTVGDTKLAVKKVRAHSAGIPIEASGGMRLDTVRDYALAGVDYISVGALTHSATAIDLSMRITADLY
jgi:nicotinate-nucleotide pyrophosphorylase (carboxylating)